MNAEAKEIFDKLISFELLIAKIYMRFSQMFPEDADFWWKLVIEEKGHAAILRSGYESFAPMNLFPAELTAISFTELQAALEGKEAFIKAIDENPASFDRRKALLAAIKIEEQDIEKIFEELMEYAPATRAIALFQQLNEGSRGHARRMIEHLKNIS